MTMRKIVLVSLFLVILIIGAEARKTSRSRSSGSGRGTSRKTNSQPVPTSFSNPQASAPKPSLFGWQEKPATRNTQTHSKPSNPSNTQSHSNPGSHSYPSSQTGLSGNTPVKQTPTNQESVQKSAIPQQTANQPVQNNNQPSHAYPSSNGLSGSSGSGYPQGSGLSGSGSVPAHSSGAGYPQSSGASGGAGYPQGTGLSGSGSVPGHSSGVGYHQSNGASGGAGYPQGSGVVGAGGAPPPYSGYKPGSYSGNYPSHHQGPPPAYGSNYGAGGYGGYGGHGHGFNSPGYSPQNPGYFGNYGNRGFGGVSRPGSALTGLGLAGAGVGTVLTGLALWNLARSTGNHHHTVIYDNRGQPVAVAPANGTEPEVDSILKDLVNCTLTISNTNATEILAIPCAIATSFTPDADVKEVDPAAGKSDTTKCIVTVVTNTGKEYMTTIPCSTLLNTAAENNVTEPLPIENLNTSMEPVSDAPNQTQPSALRLSEDGITQDLGKDCKSNLETGDVRDPINPCLAVTHNLTVIPLDLTTPTSTGSQ